MLTLPNGETLEFDPGDYGWKAPVPKDIATFFDLPFTVDIETRHIPTHPATLPRIHDSQLRLVMSILNNLSTTVPEAEKRLEEYYADVDVEFAEIKSNLDAPRIWLRLEDTDNLRVPQPRGDNEWALVVGFKDAPDFGHHIEFDLDDFQTVWAGD